MQVSEATPSRASQSTSKPSNASNVTESTPSTSEKGKDRPDEGHMISTNHCVLKITGILKWDVLSDDCFSQMFLSFTNVPTIVHKLIQR